MPTHTYHSYMPTHTHHSYMPTHGIIARTQALHYYIHTNFKTTCQHAKYGVSCKKDQTLVFTTWHVIHSYRVCNDAYPSYSSILHSCNFVSVWSLPEVLAVCHNVADITCGRAAHICFALPVAPQMLRCRGGSLSRAHSVGRPPCTPRQCVTTREVFLWVDVILLQVALGSLPLFLPLRDTSFGWLTQERLGG